MISIEWQLVALKHEQFWYKSKYSSTPQTMVVRRAHLAGKKLML